MTTKNERAAQARAKAQAEAKAKERRTTAVIVAVAIGAIAVFAGVVAFIVNSSNVPTLDEMWAMPEPPVPAGSDSTGGIGIGAGAVAGEDVPTEAIRVDLYLDFLCPFCKQFEEVNGADLDALRGDGTIALYYHPVSILNRYSAGTEYPTRAANAAAVVADAAPEFYLPFSEALFAQQPEEGTPGFTDDTIASMAVAVGVAEDVADTFANGEFTAWVTAATDQASIHGMATTPTVMVNGEVLDPKVVPFFDDGALKAYLESLPTPSSTPPGPGGS